MNSRSPNLPSRPAPVTGKNFNILLTSAGQRSYLVNYFKQALAGKGTVVCANLYPNTPAMIAADYAMVVPPSYHSDYIPRIFEICEQYAIDMICSCHDLDSFILSQQLENFRDKGIIPVLPDAEWGRITLDKYECNQRLAAAGIPVPRNTIRLENALQALDRGELNFPLILKARLGFGSLGLVRCDSRPFLIDAHQRLVAQMSRFISVRFLQQPPEDSVVIEQGIEGQEYCIGVVNDLGGNHAAHFMTQVWEMRCGESQTAITADPARAAKLAERISQLTRHVGWWGVDVLDDGQHLQVIDINPRFTGDYPFSHLAGANIPAALIAWARGEVPPASFLTAEVGVSGYKDMVPQRFLPRPESRPTELQKSYESKQQLR